MYDKEPDNPGRDAGSPSQTRPRTAPPGPVSTGTVGCCCRPPLGSLSMPRRRAVLAAAVTSLVAGCGAQGQPIVKGPGPDVTYPGTPAPSVGPSGQPSACAASPASSGTHPSAGPAGAMRLTGSDA